MQQRHATTRLIAAALIGGALAARGAGLWLYERGTPDNMTAVAGRAASALDASTASTNPAGMTRLQQPQLVLGLQPMYMDTQFDANSATTVIGDEGGQAGGVMPAGGFYYVYPASERLRLGWSSISAYGAAMDFGGEFVGRYTATDVSLTTLTTGPSIAYRFADWLSVGAMAFVTYAELEQNISVPNRGFADGRVTLEDETLGYGGSIGALFEISDRTRLGIAYTTPVKLKFKDAASSTDLGPGWQWMLGRLSLQGGKTNLEMTIPQGIMTSIHHDLNDRWSVMANFGWQDTSEAGQMDVEYNSFGRHVETTMDRRFHDTYHVALGARCRLNEQWTLGFGVAYDSSPVNDEDRTIDMPLDEQWRVATGLQYAINDRHTVGLAYTFVDLGKAAVDQSYTGGTRMVGDFDRNYLHIVTMTWNVKF